MSFVEADRKHYNNLSTYGVVPRDWVPQNGPDSAVPNSGNLIDDLCYFFKFHETLKPFVIENDRAKITLAKNGKELNIHIHTNRNIGRISLSGDLIIIDKVYFHVGIDRVDSDHEFNQIVYLLYSFENVFYSYA